jgi:hypothetical protein
MKDGYAQLIDYTGLSELDELLRPNEALGSLKDDTLKLADPDVSLRMSDLNKTDGSQIDQPIGRTKYINDWLLRILRGSRQEIFTLQQLIRQHITLDPKDVKAKVLEWWPKDKAAMSPVISENSIRGYSTISAKNAVGRNAISLRDDVSSFHNSDVLTAWTM